MALALALSDSLSISICYECISGTTAASGTEDTGREKHRDRDIDIDKTKKDDKLENKGTNV